MYALELSFHITDIVGESLNHILNSNTGKGIILYSLNLGVAYLTKLN